MRVFTNFRGAAGVKEAAQGVACIIVRPEFSPPHTCKNTLMNTTKIPPSATSSQAALADPGQYLTLRLGTEEYAIDILRVQEIRSYEEPTRMANAPAFVKGVINLRGAIVPIVDLRLKLELDKVENNSFTVVILLNVHNTVVGAVVDGVSDVVTLTDQNIKAAPQFDSKIDSRFIIGIADVAGRMLIVMNVAALLSPAEMGMSSN
jgi:purine-binding chemotaxis protein CheW